MNACSISATWIRPCEARSRAGYSTRGQRETSGWPRLRKRKILLQFRDETTCFDVNTLADVRRAVSAMIEGELPNEERSGLGTQRFKRIPSSRFISMKRITYRWKESPFFFHARERAALRMGQKCCSFATVRLNLDVIASFRSCRYMCTWLR
jgi:hypothetical protein